MKTVIMHLGLVKKDNWTGDAWHVRINDKDFAYYTGLGHRKKANKHFNTDGMPVTPQIDDILECLFSDAQAGTESFKDFCDNFGYSDDSLRALDTYRACMATTDKLRKALGKEYAEVKARIEKRAC